MTISLLIDILAVICSLALMLFLYNQLSFSKNILKLKMGVKRSLSILRSNKISDYWKEKVIPNYALMIFVESLRFFVYLSLLLLAFIIAFVGIELAFRADIHIVVERLYSWELQFLIIVFGLFLVLIRLIRK